MNGLQFLKQFLQQPRRVGAIAPSGRFLAKKMMAPIQFDQARCIVEYGPGTGSFTQELIRRRVKGTRLLLIEQNPSFCNQLKERFAGVEGITIQNGSAAQVNDYLAQLGLDKADYVVSGLPFSSLPVSVSEEILRETQRAIGVRGRFLTFQYTMVKKKFFLQYFDLNDKLYEVRNLPPAHVLVMGRKVAG